MGGAAGFLFCIADYPQSKKWTQYIVIVPLIDALFVLVIFNNGIFSKK